MSDDWITWEEARAARPVDEDEVAKIVDRLRSEQHSPDCSCCKDLDDVAHYLGFDPAELEDDDE